MIVGRREYEAKSSKDLKVQSHSRENSRAAGSLETLKPRLLDAKDAAMYLGISETRVREYVKYGKLRCVTLPHPFRSSKDTRKLLIQVSELDDFIDKYKPRDIGE
jgi:hypothetical protein